MSTSEYRDSSSIAHGAPIVPIGIAPQSSAVTTDSQSFGEQSFGEQPVEEQPFDIQRPDLQRRGVPGRGVPENWFVDPVRLGVPGVRRPHIDDEEVLSWQADSLCAQTDPEAFFPEKGGSTREAKKICASCEVRTNCLEYALENDERFGIWGGLSERERRKLRKRA